MSMQRSTFLLHRVSAAMLRQMKKFVSAKEQDAQAIEALTDILGVEIMQSRDMQQSAPFIGTTSRMVDRGRDRIGIAP